ncbi:hypothetical protein [Streptomyces sp. NPDC058751]|uniref:hypothetical protein n=1 Tax=Streptomyces sp. NPDC058751 TaxID=3346623 RepID=UPI0036C7BA76
MAAPAHLLPTVPSERAAEPALPGPRAGRASDGPGGAHPCPLGLEGTCSTAPLTSEPPLPDAEPLTSEPPLADAAHLTSEPTSAGAASGA